MFTVKQISNDDCGFASLKVLLANLYNKEDYLYLRQDENHGPYSYKQVIDIAKEYGATLQGIKVEGDDLDEFKNLPCLVSISENDDTLHMVYLKSIGRVFVHIFDPERGNLLMLKKTFLTKWDKTALIITNHKEKEVNFYRKDITFTERILSIAFQVLSLASICVGFMFIDENSYIFVPVIALSCGAILQVVYQTYLSFLMKRVDERYLTELESVPIDNREYLKRFSDFKKSVFVSPINLVTNACISIFLIVILAINNKYNLLIPFAVVLILLVDVGIIHPKNKEREREIAKMEEFRDINDIGEFKDIFREINTLGYSLANRYSIYQLLRLFILLLVTIGVMILNNVVSVPFVITYLFFGTIIYTSLKKVIFFDDDVDEIKKNRVKFYNSFKK